MDSGPGVEAAESVEDSGGDIAPETWKELVTSDLVISSRTKLRILSELRKRRSTGAEIARSLDQDRSGVYRHLDELREKGYVERFETHRKWVYYGLTSKGRILERVGDHLLAVLVLSGLSGVLTFLVWRWMVAVSDWERVTRDVDPGPRGPKPEFPIVWVLTTVTSAAIILLVYYLHRWHHRS